MTRGVVWIIVLGVLASCGGEEALDIQFDRGEFETNREIWRSQDIVNYSFNFIVCCDEPIEFTIRVVNDKVVETIGPGVLDPDTPNAITPSTINEFYDEIELLANNPGDPSITPNFYLLGIDIIYDPQHKFPSDVTFNFHNPDQRGSNFSWSIESFVPE